MRTPVQLTAQQVTGVDSDTGDWLFSPGGKLLLYDINGIQEIEASDGGGSLVYVGGRPTPHRVCETANVVAARVKEAEQ